jgi:retron-type reverse transcriptase
VLDLLKAFLKQPVQEEPDKSSPQGSVTSPLRANIHLDPLDQLLAARGIRSVRYADDIVFLTEREEAAREALEVVSGWMEGAQFTLYPDKACIVDMGQPGSYLDFPGYRFQRSSGRILEKEEKIWEKLEM